VSDFREALEQREHVDAYRGSPAFEDEREELLRELEDEALSEEGGVTPSPLLDGRDDVAPLAAARDAGASLGTSPPAESASTHPEAWTE
jgi:hypothetical protein